MIGQTIGNYVVREEIGRGGMGAVYVAEHPRIGRRVAIKVLHAEVGSDPEIVARFFNEAKAANDIRNAHIVEVLDFGELPGGAPYLVMEWLEGRSLADLLEEGGRVPLAHAAHILDGVGKALAAAHARGVIHRDLKPDNIYLSRRDEQHDFVKVLDFGIAKLLVSGEGAPRTKTNVVLGTPAYMSPEQCRGESSTLDGRSDIYALGVILYEMLSGRRPFDAETYTGVLLKHITAPVPPLREHAPGIPEGVEKTILRALEKDREERFARVEELVAAFAAACGEAPSEVVGDEPKEAKEPKVPRAVEAVAPAPPTPLPTMSGEIGRPAKRSVVDPKRFLVGAAALSVLVLVAAFVMRGAGKKDAAPPPPSLASIVTPPSAPTANNAPSTNDVPPANIAPDRTNAPAKTHPPPAAITAAKTKTPTTATAPTNDERRIGKNATPQAVLPRPAEPPPPQARPADPRTPPPGPTDPYALVDAPPARQPAAAPIRSTLGRKNPDDEEEEGGEERRPEKASPGDYAALDRLVSAEAARLAPGGKRVGPRLHGEGGDGEGQDRYVTLEAGRCYVFLSAGDMPRLYTYLWDPSGKRLADHRSDNHISTFTACATVSGHHKFQGKPARGPGAFSTAVYEK